MTLKIKWIMIALLIGGFFLNVPASAQEPATTPAASSPTAQSSIDANGTGFVPGEILIKFKSGAQSKSAQRGLARIQGRVKQTVSAIDVVRVEVPEGRELAAIEALRKDNDVEFVEPNYIAQALYTPNDPGFSSQWGYTKAQFSTAWEVTQGNSNLVVAIVDSGIDLDHSDLNCTVSGGANKIVSGYNFVSDTDNPDDDNGHGTHVAGTVAACTNNGSGVAGAAPNVRLMPVKVLNSSGNGSYSGVANGIIYAADHGANIINMSLGGSASSSILEDAVKYAYNKGVLIIAASGNANSDLYYPAAYSQVMAIGASDSSDVRASFSNYGSGLDVVAPGQLIYSTLPGGYTYLSGTSMASPHVAGLAALIWSAEPSLTNTEIRQIIRDTADDLGSPGYDIFYGYGRINAWKALESYATVDVQYSNGGEINGPIPFFLDDVSAAAASNAIRISKASTETITWNVTVSPSKSWLSVSLSGSGLTASEAYGDYVLDVTRPITYGTYTTNLVITGETASNTQVGPETISVKLVYTPEIKTFFFPMMFH
ncbi:MAG: S8 family serine peptidase [Anaerolineae bacterium]|nr:S8 family serine peptidase [Anaerolineae bacterium]